MANGRAKESSSTLPFCGDIFKNLPNNENNNGGLLKINNCIENLLDQNIDLHQIVSDQIYLHFQ